MYSNQQANIESSLSFYVGAGIGVSMYSLNAFDNALINAGVGDFNLIRLSSILPPNSSQKDSISLLKGSYLHTAYSSLTSSNNKQIISSGIGFALPKDLSLPGVIMECSCQDKKNVAEKQINEMLKIAMSTRHINDYIIELFSVEAIVTDLYTCTFACISMW